MHMTTSVPLFNRAILMSGTAATGPPVAMKYKEAEYLALLKYLGIDEQDPKRFEKLMGVEVEKIVEAIEGVQIPIFRALAHESFFERGNPTWWTENKLIGECEWVDDIMIGDCFYEVILFGSV
jgi:carboxylesterase type B